MTALRNCIVHGNGGLEGLKDSDRATIQALMRTHKGITIGKENTLIIEAIFVWFLCIRMRRITQNLYEANGIPGVIRLKRKKLLRAT